jgi:hypothetical protein
LPTPAFISGPAGIIDIFWISVLGGAMDSAFLFLQEYFENLLSSPPFFKLIEL